MIILIVISPYTPAQTPNTLRWNAIIEEWLKKGYEIHVISSRWAGAPEFSKHGDLYVHRFGHHSLLDAFQTGLKERKGEISRMVYK
jgi:hypothetical protein